MRLCSTFLRLAIFCFCCFSMLTASAQQPSSDEHVHIEPTPAWVDVREHRMAESVPLDDIQDGVFYQLLEDQIKVEENGDRYSYRRFIETAVNQTGVDGSSQINIAFDPIYQRVVLHSLFVIRNGERIDRLEDAKVSVFSRETELDNQIYNGKLTLNILLDDIQIGDTLDYSFTREGSNPVYKNIFSTSRSLNWSVPVYQQSFRVLWGKDSPLHINFRNLDVPVARKQLGEYVEYQIELQEQEVVDSPSEAPGWYSPFGRVYLSEMKDWKEVVAWAEPMYRFGAPHPEIKKIAAQIRQSSPTAAEQIAAALKFTQDTVRYVGLEMGQNSHLPRAPEQTLSLKYGDCKDKTTLFVSILEALGVEAHPALVNTEETKLLAELPVGVNLFDHVIVWLEFDGEEFWLDPTLSNQAGNLDNVFKPDYGYALILKKGSDALTPMEREENDAFTEVSEKFEIPASDDEPVTFSVRTRYKGYEAIRKLWQLERDGRSGVADDYEAYYQGNFAGLKLKDELVIENDETSGVLTIDEFYEIGPFWTQDENKLEADFYAADIRNAVFKPDELQRSGPLWFEYPNHIRSSIDLVFEEDDWSFNPESFTDDNDFFFFTFDVSVKEKQLTLSYEFRSKTDHIPQDRIDDYLKARDVLRENTYYGIYKGADSSAETVEENTQSAELFEINWLWVLGIAFVLGPLYVLIDWRLESGKRPEFPESEFYPVALWKLVFLSLFTLGIYINYWMYRNWKAVKARTGKSMMPFWRGFFAYFWMYPLFLVLKKDSEDTYQENRVVAPWLAGCIALMLLMIYVLGQWAEGVLMVLLFVVPALLLTPFVAYIQSRNTPSSEALRFNSRWRLRHVVTALLMAPILFVLLASDIKFLPSDAVVTQAELMDRDLKFFYRQKLIVPGDDIQYFYSDAILSIRADGNGFTNERVFSYWEDADGGLAQEIALFEDVADIEVQFTESDWENTVITITRTDGSDFLLFVSNVNEGDALFVAELRARWEATKRSTESEEKAQEPPAG